MKILARVKHIVWENAEQFSQDITDALMEGWDMAEMFYIEGVPVQRMYQTSEVDNIIPFPTQSRQLIS